MKSAAYAKLHQRASHYAVVGVAAALDVKGGVDSVGAHRSHRRDDARDAMAERREGAGRQEGAMASRPRRHRPRATSPT